jgi:hypothetical protein
MSNSKEYNKKYYDAHLDYHRARYKKKVDKMGLEAIATEMREKRQLNPMPSRNDCRQRMRLKRERVLEHYGTKCGCCSETRREFLVLDHVDGGGNQHRKKLRKTGDGFYEWIIKNNFPEGYRILCDNCNSSMGRYNYCPHMIEQGLISANDVIHLRETRRTSYKENENTKDVI